jgi:hypothetical protein
MVDWKSRQLKLTAGLTIRLVNMHIIDACNGISGRIIVWEKLRAWHVWLLSSVFSLVFVFCLLDNRLLFDGCDNPLEEYLTESL